MKRVLPSTSHEANRRATEEMRSAHKAKIVDALGQIVTGNYEMISQKCGLDKIAVMRRLSELEREQVVFKPGLKSNTSSGRQAFNYQLTSQPSLTPIEVVDKMIENATKPEFVQTDLFGNKI